MKLKIISKIAVLLQRRQPAEYKSSSREEHRKRVVEAVRRWIKDRRWTEDATQSEVAASLDIGKEELSRHFRKHFGKSFLQWRKEARINEAKQLLLKDMKTPTAIIGEAVGINDKSNFKRQFRDIVGCTPAQWRLKQQVKVGLK